MLDINYIRENVDLVKKATLDKNVDVAIDELLELDKRRRALQQHLDSISARRNALAKDAQGSQPTAHQIAQGKELKVQASAAETDLNGVQEKYFQLLKQVPNIPSADTPVGADEAANKVLRQVGTKPEFDFAPKEHFELGEQLDVIESKAAGEVSGSRFAYLKGELVLMQFALIQYALSIVTSEERLGVIAQEAGLDVPTVPFIPVIPPVMIKPNVFEQMARLEPKEERYHIPSDNLYLVGSAEHTLGPLHMKETLQKPQRYVGCSTAFRREAGSHGKDVRGILRLHQFDKIEIESFTAPANSIVEQDFIVAIQEYLMQALSLAYQVVLKCTGDMGGPDYRAIDIETWMPGQNKYRETHTSDLMTDYQARRLGTKIVTASGKKVYAHMNDATVFAIGRTLIAIMENYQQADGSITVPDVLQQYVSFTHIRR
jgi:seryl-tRNA synthetase